MNASEICKNNQLPCIVQETGNENYQLVVQSSRWQLKNWIFHAKCSEIINLKLTFDDCNLIARNGMHLKSVGMIKNHVKYKKQVMKIISLLCRVQDGSSKMGFFT